MAGAQDTDKALVLFSGGQDSTVCLAWALDRFPHVETIGFNYGQRHWAELEARAHVLTLLRERFADWAARLKDDHLLDADLIGEVTETALTRETAITTGPHGLPTTFVPGRNLLFFTLAAALAYGRGIKHLVGGMCETDFSGYPDCRDDTLKALQVALNLGLETRFVIETPLMWRTKAETWALAQELGGAPLVELVIEHTHTCYLGDRSVRHDWGYGCGHCPACVLRAKGFAAWKAARTP